MAVTPLIRGTLVTAAADADADAEPLNRPAVAAHKGDGRPFGQARTRLLYGKWLGRSQRRADAELRAAGAVPSAVTPSDPVARLTPQELQVVRLAADGTSNKQTGAQLLLSPRTVGCHPWATPYPSSASPPAKSWPATRHDLTAAPGRQAEPGHRDRGGSVSSEVAAVRGAAQLYRV